jgi:hypothetical protein
MTFFQGVARSSNCAVDHQACLVLFRIEDIKKTLVRKREELYRGPIEPGWGAGLLNPAQGGESGNILYMTPLPLKSFLYVFLHSTSIVSSFTNRFGKRTLSISVATPALLR